MKINGLQKLTLLDFPGRTACTVFLAGCDLRCPFCHNAELIDGIAPAVMEDGELLAFLEKRRGLLDGVCFTGGEPLLRKDLPELIAKIRTLGYAVKLDTNGTHPAALKALLDAGLLDYAAMDIKNDPARYAATCGLETMDLSPVLESVALLKASGIDFEFRTTAVRELHDDESFRGIARLIDGAPRYAIQAFADRDTVAFSGLSSPEKADMERWAELVRPFVREVILRGVYLRSGTTSCALKIFRPLYIDTAGRP